MDNAHVGDPSRFSRTDLAAEQILVDHIPDSTPRLREAVLSP